MKPRHVIGLDLGQAADYSALAVLESKLPPCPPKERTPTRPEHHIRYLKRWTLGTSYPTIVSDVVSLFKTPELAGSLLVVDQTGVGRPVVEMFSQAMQNSVNGFMCAVTITSGHEVVHAGDARWNVPKKILVSTLQVLLQNHRLRVAPGLKEAPTLLRELLTFRVKVTSAGNETFEAWRERDHDDLVLAVALACWGAEMSAGSVS